MGHKKHSKGMNQGMISRIQNSCLCAEISSFGAEIQSVTSADGAEYIWQGDPAYWKDRAITILTY